MTDYEAAERAAHAAWQAALAEWTLTSHGSDADEALTDRCLDLCKRWLAWQSAKPAAVRLDLDEGALGHSLIFAPKEDGALCLMYRFMAAQKIEGYEDENGDHAPDED